MTSLSTKSKLTPPALARRWGISADKVLAWIRSGELKAINAATRPGGRPRYVIDEADVVRFEGSRAATQATTIKRKTCRKNHDIIEFF